MPISDYTTLLISDEIKFSITHKLSFPNDDALKKAVFLALGEIERKWTMPVRDWGLIMNQFICIFDKRVQI
ncbi:MAG: hypothetical protein ACRCTQ_07120 [Brevinemataceae bacterium]